MRRSPGQVEFEFFVAEASPDLLRTAYLITWDLGAAEDLTQETLWRIARRWRRVAAMEHPRAYARTILVNLALRERSRGTEEAPLTEGVDVAADLSSVDDRADLGAALATLSPRQRSVIVLRFFSGLSERETADALGWPLGTVKSATARALADLRAHATRSLPANPIGQPKGDPS